MLKDEVVEAVQDGRFNIWAVETIDQGIEILTGVPAGRKGGDGKFPEGTVHYLVDKRLREMADKVRDFGTTNGYAPRTRREKVAM
jgi:predicted ATP-dependent protease